MQKEKSDIMRELKEQNNFWSHKKKISSLKRLEDCSNFLGEFSFGGRPQNSHVKYSMQNYLKWVFYLPTLEHTHKHKYTNTHTSTHMCIHDINNHSYPD